MSNHPSYPSHPVGPYARPPEPVGVSRPPAITYAVYGMYLGLALSLVSPLLVLTHLDALRTAAQERLASTASPGLDTTPAVHLAVVAGLVSALIGVVIDAGLWIWMAVANGRGIGWARVVATVLGALAVVDETIALVGRALLPTTASGLPGTSILAGIDLVLAIVLLVLLWLPSSSAYYRAVAAARTARRY